MVNEIRSTLKQVTLYYYMTIIVAIVLIISIAKIDHSIDKSITIILAIYLLAFPIVFRYTYRYALHIFLFMLAFISGFYGFYHLSIDNHSISNALYFTFRLFLLDFADVFTVDGTSPEQYPLLLEIARWSAASYTISTVFIAMYRTLEMKILLFRAQRFGNHYVIYGYNENSHILIEDLRKTREKVIVIDEQFSPETTQMLENMNVIVLQMVIHNQTSFTKSAIHKAKAVMLFHEKDSDSLYTLMELENYAQREPTRFQLKKLIIHLENVRYQKELTTFIEDMEGFSFPVEMINIYENLAAKFWQDHAHIFKTEANVDLLVVGYGEIGQQITAQAKYMYEMKQQRAGFSVTVLADFVRQETDGYITKVPFDVETDLLETVITRNEKNFTHIFICLEEDYVDLMEGMELSDIFPAIPVYMNFTDNLIDHTFKIATTKTAKTLYSMGTFNDVLTKESLDI